MRGVAVLGSTGSIGESALSVLARHRDSFRLVALTAGRNRARLEAQVAAWAPAFAGLVEGEAGPGIRTGREVLVEAATHPDVEVVLNAVVGAAERLDAADAGAAAQRPDGHLVADGQ